MRIARSLGQSVPTLILFLTTKFGMLLNYSVTAAKNPSLTSTP
jgi:hypothetical protein